MPRALYLQQGANVRPGGIADSTMQALARRFPCRACPQSERVTRRVARPDVLPAQPPDGLIRHDSLRVVQSAGACACACAVGLHDSALFARQYTVIMGGDKYIVLADSADGMPRIMMSRDLKVPPAARACLALSHARLAQMTGLKFTKGQALFLPISAAERAHCKPSTTTTPSPPPRLRSVAAAAFLEVASMKAHLNRMAAEEARMERLEAEISASGSARDRAAGCSNDMVGDGSCDRACNNAENQWDGGDCCRGLCIDGKR
jgi:hypothetical protein